MNVIRLHKKPYTKLLLPDTKEEGKNPRTLEGPAEHKEENMSREGLIRKPIEGTVRWKSEKIHMKGRGNEGKKNTEDPRHNSQ